MWLILISIWLIGIAILFSPFTSVSYIKYVQAAEKPDIKTYALEQVKKEWGEKQWSYFDALIKRESNWNSEVKNPKSSAYGYGQFLDSTWKTVGCIKTIDQYEQIDCTISYVKARYENPQKTIAFWDKKHWY